uniref:Uncharacterized protein n=1 Tax=Oryza punctata TaxID=4537 RepID=A0A0E0LV34_ORYPU
MAAAAAATAHSSAAPQASPTLRRSGSSGDSQWIVALPESSSKDITVSLNAYRNCRFGLFASTAKAELQRQQGGPPIAIEMATCGDCHMFPSEMISHKTHPISTCYPDEGTRRKEKEVSVADRDSSNPSRLLHAHFTQESTLQTAPYAAAAGQQLPWSDFSIAFSLLNFRLLLRFWLRFDALSDL